MARLVTGDERHQRRGGGPAHGKVLELRAPAVSCGRLAGSYRISLLAGQPRAEGDGQMRDLDAFRAALRERLRAVGCTQQQLARAIGLHPHVLSHKLHERDTSALSGPEVVSIVVTLAGWGGIGSKADAHALLALMALPPEAIPAEAWAAKPLVLLPEGVLPEIPRDEVRPTAEAALTSDAALPLPSPTQGEGAWPRQFCRWPIWRCWEGRPRSRPAHKCALLSAGKEPRKRWRPCSARKGRGW